MCEDFKRLEIDDGARHRHSKWFADKGYRAQLEDFFAAIREGRDPAVTVLDGVRSTMACLGMIEAARSHQPYDLRLDQFVG